MSSPRPSHHRPSTRGNLHVGSMQPVTGGGSVSLTGWPGFIDELVYLWSRAYYATGVCVRGRLLGHQPSTSFRPVLPPSSRLLSSFSWSSFSSSLSSSPCSLLLFVVASFCRLQSPLSSSVTIGSDLELHRDGALGLCLAWIVVFFRFVWSFTCRAGLLLEDGPTDGRTDGT